MFVKFDISVVIEKAVEKIQAPLKKVVEKFETHVLCSITSFRQLYLLYNIVERVRPQMPIWCMRIACWIPKATDTHWEYVILIAFSLQHWLLERALKLHDTYSACLVKDQSVIYRELKKKLQHWKWCTPYLSKLGFPRYSLFGRSCDRPPRHRFFLVSLCLKANAEMVPKIPSFHYMLLM